jgi:hypothetical protein
MEVMRRLRAGEEGDKSETAAGEGVAMATNTLPQVFGLISDGNSQRRIVATGEYEFPISTLDAYSPNA